LGLVALGVTLWMQARDTGSERVYRSRNFYGVLTVYEHEKNQPLSHYFLLQHGRITHGLQFADPVQATWPISYYGKDSGIGLAVDALPAGPRRIGVVGLGTGTMAAFGRAGDYLRFYEINPQVLAVATSWFSYLPKCLGNVEVAPGDARLSLEREPPQHFDLLVLDAFSGDAIPVHLLTKEAFETYERHLNTNAIIAVHISNHYLNLEPVVVNLARQFHYKLASIDYEEAEDEWWLYGSTWVLLSRSEQVMSLPAIRDAASMVSTNSTKVPLWTDDFASLFQILR
jgi:spermidine synthase